MTIIVVAKEHKRYYRTNIQTSDDATALAKRMSRFSSVWRTLFNDSAAFMKRTNQPLTFKPDKFSAHPFKGIKIACGQRAFLFPYAFTTPSQDAQDTLVGLLLLSQFKAIVCSSIYWLRSVSFINHRTIGVVTIIHWRDRQTDGHMIWMYFNETLSQPIH